MTRIGKDKEGRDRELRREVSGGRFGPLVVIATEKHVYLREPGKRRRMGPLSWADLYVHLAGLTAGKRKVRKAGRSRLRVGV